MAQAEKGKLSANDQPAFGHAVGERTAPGAQEKRRSNLHGREERRPLGLMRLLRAPTT